MACGCDELKSPVSARYRARHKQGRQGAVHADTCRLAIPDGVCMPVR